MILNCIGTTIMEIWSMKGAPTLPLLPGLCAKTWTCVEYPFIALYPRTMSKKNQLCKNINMNMTSRKEHNLKLVDMSLKPFKQNKIPWLKKDEYIYNWFPAILVGMYRNITKFCKIRLFNFVTALISFLFCVKKIVVFTIISTNCKEPNGTWTHEKKVFRFYLLTRTLQLASISLARSNLAQSYNCRAPSENWTHNRRTSFNYLQQANVY